MEEKMYGDIEYPKVTRVFIVQSTNGKTEKQCKLDRLSAIKSITEKYDDAWVFGVHFENCDLEKGKVNLSALAWSIERMEKSDVIYFCKDWDQSPGCRILNELASRNGIDFIEDYRPRPKKKTTFRELSEHQIKCCHRAYWWGRIRQSGDPNKEMLFEDWRKESEKLGEAIL